MEIISNIALISINETLIVQVISFLIFLFLINRIMFRPLRSVMDDRERYIENVSKDIAAAEDQYKSLTQQIKHEESKIKKEAFALRAKLEEAGNRQAIEILDATRKQINDLRKDAQNTIDGQVRQARKQLPSESEALALNIMERVLGRRMRP